LKVKEKRAYSKRINYIYIHASNDKAARRLNVKGTEEQQTKADRRIHIKITATGSPAKKGSPYN